MNKRFLILTTLVCLVTLVAAKEQPTTATIVSEKGVDCGSKAKNKKETVAILCQQYLIRSTTTEYQVRQQKPSNQELLPLNTSIQITLDKDKMKFKVNGKKYEFLVVSVAPVGTPPQ
jgi:hypothetical protein